MSVPEKVSTSTPISVEIVVNVIVLLIEVVCCHVVAAAERISILDLFDSLQDDADTVLRIVVGIEGNDCTDIAARIQIVGVDDLDAVLVEKLRLAAGSRAEVVVAVVSSGTISRFISVMDRERQLARDLAAPLRALAGFLRLINGLVEYLEACLVVAGDNQGRAVLFAGLVLFEEMRIGESYQTGDDVSVFLIFATIISPPLYWRPSVRPV